MIGAMLKINKDIRSKDEKVDAYIVSLEDYFEKLQASNIMKLIVECDEASGTMADDVRLLRTETDDEKLESELKMLGSKKNKRFEAFLSLVKSVKDLKGISDMMDELKPKNEEKQVNTEDGSNNPSKKKKSNIQDFIIN